MSDTNSFDFRKSTVDPPPANGDATAKVLDAAGHALLERLGAGGMGEVYRCGDEALQRDLAIKILKAELRGNADAEERFLREARLTGSLQHPGIVPIHNLSRLADGRPCYTMKLVRGRTFADMLRDEPQGPERLPRLLTILEKVGQAVAFAHSKRVIHRDLKPSNVMVGEFGEVQVMDWGLAKDLHANGSAVEPASGDAPSATEFETGEWVAESEGLSRVGAALGTLAYMPPEQAAGDWPLVDERADVFALGAILCEVLTGKPPYHGRSRDDLFQQARRGDMREAMGRLQMCGADTALATLCRECLSAVHVSRPRHAGMVAERLASYEAEVRERLRHAELQRVAAESRALAEAERAREAQARAAAERRARRLTLALATAAVVLIAAGVGAWWWQRRQVEQTDRAVGNGLSQAELLAKQARADPLQPEKYHQALEAAQVAAKLAENASADTSRRAGELLARLDEEDKAARKDRELLAALLDVRGPQEGPKYKSDTKEAITAMEEPTADEQFAAAFRRWGLDMDGTAPEEVKSRLKARPPVVVREVSAALDEWAGERRRQGKEKEAWQHLVDLAAALDDDSSSKPRELRQIMARDRLPRERALDALSAALRPVPLAVEIPLGPDRQRLRQLADQTDAAGDPILSLLTLVRALQAAGDEARAEQLLHAAIGARPREIVLHHTLGQLLKSQQPPRWAEAVECYGAARTLRPDLGVNLATALRKSGRENEGLALLARLVTERRSNPYLHFERAIALSAGTELDEAVAEYRQAIDLDPKYAVAHNNLGVALKEKGRLDEAVAEYRQAIALEPKLAPFHHNLGVALHTKGQVDEAVDEYRQALALDSKYAKFHANLGNALSDKGQVDEAVAEYRQAIALEPKLAPAHYNLGNALKNRGQVDEAVYEYRQAIALDPKLALAHYNLGNALKDKGQVNEAVDEYRRAIGLDPKYAPAHHNLGNALKDKGQVDEAVAEYRQAIALDPKPALAHNSLGLALSDTGQLDEAEIEYRRAITRDPKLAVAHSNLGSVLRAKGQLDEAMAEYHQALALDPKLSLAHNNLGNALHAKGQLNEAVVEYRQAIRLKLDFAPSHCNLGQVLLQQGRFDEALASLRRGHELGSKQPGWRHPSAQWIRDAERLLVLDKKLPAILRGEELPANPGECIALAWICQQPYKRRLAASARLHADAFAADPKLAANLQQQIRYNAACSAAMAAAGKGEDARLLPNKVAAMFRRWALQWLRADLTAYAKLAQRNVPASSKAIQQRLAHWLSDPDLSSVRDPQALDRLPDNERTVWQALWHDVDELAKQAAKSGQSRPTQYKAKP